MKGSVRQDRFWSDGSGSSGAGMHHSTKSRFIVILTTENLNPNNTYHFQPKVIQLRGSLLLVQVDEPASSSAVVLILPHGFNALLEHRLEETHALVPTTCTFNPPTPRPPSTTRHPHTPTLPCPLPPSPALHQVAKYRLQEVQSAWSNLPAPALTTQPLHAHHARTHAYALTLPHAHFPLPPVVLVHYLLERRSTFPSGEPLPGVTLSSRPAMHHNITFQ
ncbi:hypothetical protein E2C01_014895 [Portunus trituberculatus]|uniref:Uncharacterized protein n=1 Tax=Portunus trituberculatus TaxID=210409 RepID=A0A5B7DJW3_PORTR|nr:hypothetical protein [Portunus trituberculatus]